MKGVYVLILRLDRDKNITIGKLGSIHFKKGYYAYTGSARGTGGIKRVERHFDVAAGENSTRKWHIDYLMPHSEVLSAVFLPTGEALECAVAASLEFEGIPGFGCSDCTCRSHLFFSQEDFRNDIITTLNSLTGNESIIIHPHK
jgi:Uri superfamily endonuclease